MIQAGNDKKLTRVVVTMERRTGTRDILGRETFWGTPLSGSPPSPDLILLCPPDCWQRSGRSCWTRPISCVQDCLRLMKQGKRWNWCHWSWRMPRKRWLSSRNSVRSTWSSLCSRSGKRMSSRRWGDPQWARPSCLPIISIHWAEAAWSPSVTASGETRSTPQIFCSFIFPP